jgi:hypothetical protein
VSPTIIRVRIILPPLLSGPAPLGYPPELGSRAFTATAANKQVAASGGVMVTFPFQALLQAGGSSTAYDQSTLTIQRSNS